MAGFTTLSGRKVLFSRELGKGGEGIVNEIAGASGQVAKIYHSNLRSEEKEEKLRIMISNPPQHGKSTSHIAIAWPTELVYEQGKFAGYIMPRVMHCHSLFKIYNPPFRTKNNLSFDWKYLHRTAKNFATALNALHHCNYIVGDINQKNALVAANTLVTLVDTDSFQVKDGNGKIYRCGVGVPEYTPAELQGKNLALVERTVLHDRFALGVIIFQLLMQGYHPFTGRSNDRRLSVEGEVYLHCIKKGLFPFYPNNEFTPPPHALNFNVLHPVLQNLFVRCFVTGHSYPFTRPTAYEWIEALGKVEKSLVNCRNSPLGWHSDHVDDCHWCEQERKRSISTIRQEQAYPPLTFVPAAARTTVCGDSFLPSMDAVVMFIITLIIVSLVSVADKEDEKSQKNGGRERQDLSYSVSSVAPVAVPYYLPKNGDERHREYSRAIEDSARNPTVVPEKKGAPADKPIKGRPSSKEPAKMPQVNAKVQKQQRKSLHALHETAGTLTYKSNLTTDDHYSLSPASSTHKLSLGALPSPGIDFFTRQDPEFTAISELARTSLRNGAQGDTDESHPLDAHHHDLGDYTLNTKIDSKKWLRSERTLPFGVTAEMALTIYRVEK